MVALISIVLLVGMITDDVIILKNPSIVTIILSWLVLVAIASIYIAKNMTAPFKQVLKGIEAIESGNLNYTIEVNKKDEIGKVAQSFNLMAQSLKNTHHEIERQHLEMLQKNIELQENNLELEASYGQLQAAMDQLKEAEDKYHALVENIPDILCAFDHNEKIIFVNDMVYKILGYQKKEVIGCDITKFIDADSNQVYTLLQDIQQQLAQCSFVPMEIQFTKKDGECILTECKFTQYVFQGNILGTQVVIRDVTQKKFMEGEILKRNKEIAMIHSLSKSLNSTIELDKVLYTIGTEISEQLGACMTLVRLLDESGKNLKVRAFAGSYFKETCPKQMFPVIDIYQDKMGKALLNNQIIHTNEIQKNWFVYEDNQYKKTEEKINDLLFLPLTNKRKKLGVIVIGTNRKMNDAEVSFMHSISNNASVAIDNAMMYHNAKEYFVKTIDALIAAVEAKDKYTQGHSQRVARYGVQIATQLNLEAQQVEQIKVAGILHDIGKIGISDNILLKKDPLTVEEYREIQEHPNISKKILAPVGLSNTIIDAITFHHERIDGKGYPNTLKGDASGIHAQIIAVADAFDAMTSTRPYRKALSPEEAMEELIKNKEMQFKGEVVDAMVEIFANKREFIDTIMLYEENEIES